MQRVTPNPTLLDMDAIHDIAVGATLLGAGGGGETYLTELQLQQEFNRGANIQLMHVADVADDALVAACGWMGAPTVQKEKYANGSEAVLGLEKLEQLMGRRVDAIFPIEIGGENGLSPLLLAARHKIPVVDCDGMGRAFPEAHMVTFNIYGCGASPAIFTDDKGNVLMMEVTTNKEEERLGAADCHCHGGPLSCYRLSDDRTAVKTVCCARHYKYCTCYWSRHQRSPPRSARSLQVTIKLFSHNRLLPA